jgi:hypothetical protein
MVGVKNLYDNNKFHVFIILKHKMSFIVVNICVGRINLTSSREVRAMPI